MKVLKINEICIEIEELRENLYENANKYGIRSLATIQASQRLDARLNEYIYMKN